MRASFARFVVPSSAFGASYGVVHVPSKPPRFSGTAVRIEGRGADEVVVVEEDATHTHFYWPVWPFPYFGIRKRPFEVGTRLTFEKKADSGLIIEHLRLEENNRPPGKQGDVLIH